MLEWDLAFLRKKEDAFFYMDLELFDLEHVRVLGIFWKFEDCKKRKKEPEVDSALALMSYI